MIDAGTKVITTRELRIWCGPNPGDVLMVPKGAQGVVVCRRPSMRSGEGTVLAINFDPALHPGQIHVLETAVDALACADGLPPTPSVS